MRFFFSYDFNNERAFDSKEMRSLNKNSIFKRIKYSEMLVGLQCHISDSSEAFYKNSREKKKKPRRVLNLHSSVSKSSTLPTTLLWTALARGNFPLHILFERTLSVLTLGVDAMLFVRSPITELE